MTIGLLIESVSTQCSTEILKGTLDAAREKGCNVIRFSLANNFFTDKSRDLQTEIIYKTIEKSSIDGLLFPGWWQKYNTVEQCEEFKKRFSHIKLLSIGKPLEGFPSVFMDEGIYVAELTRHLVEVHNCRKIVFIPPVYDDGRFSAYKAVMEEHGLYDPKLTVTTKELKDQVYEDFRKRVEIVLELLLDKRKLKIDAIISMYAREAAQFVKQLKQRNIMVPGDIAVTSYEDGDAARFILPPLTTIYYPFYELGYDGCRKLIDMILQKPIEIASAINSRLIYRNSCGCNIINNRSGPVPVIMGSKKSIFNLAGDEKKAICDYLHAHTRLSSIEQFLELLISGLQSRNILAFETFFEKYLLESSVDVDDVNTIAGDINILRKAILPLVTGDREILLNFEDLWNQLYILIQERIKYILSMEQLMLSDRDIFFNEISQNIITTFNVPKLLDVFAANLKYLGIPNCFVFLYTVAGHMDYELALAYRDNQRVDVSSINPECWKDKITTSILPSDKSVTLLINILHIHEEQIGFVLYEPGPMDERLYHSLSVHLSTAFKGAYLVNNYQEINRELESTQKQLVENAYKTGMANVALGTLHNAGNILTSLNISVDLLRQSADALPLSGLKNISELVCRNKNNLSRFLSNNSKGENLIKYCQLMAKKILNIKTELAEHIDRALDKIKLILNLIESQQRYVGIVSLKERMQISSIINDALVIMESTLRKARIEITRDIADVSGIMVDKTKLIHILINLITNAVEALTIAKKEHPRITFKITEDSSCQYIQVADNGCGMDKKTRENIFQIGYTTKSSGHGFGLHSCVHYMHEMGGQIKVESAGTDMGSVFTLQFPRTDFTANG